MWEAYVPITSTAKFFTVLRNEEDWTNKEDISGQGCAWNTDELTNVRKFPSTMPDTMSLVFGECSGWDKNDKGETTVQDVNKSVTKSGTLWQLDHPHPRVYDRAMKEVQRQTNEYKKSTK